MKSNLRRLTAATSVAAIFLCFPPPSLVAAAGGGRLEGRVLDPDGRPATAYAVLLVDTQGERVAEAATSGEGRYVFAEVLPGEYRLAVADREGRLAPVLGPPARLAPAASVRRDVKLVRNEGPARLAPGAYGVRPDSWWARQTRNQKIFTLVAIGVGTAIIVALLANDNEEKKASPSGPGT